MDILYLMDNVLPVYLELKFVMLLSQLVILDLLLLIMFVLLVLQLLVPAKEIVPLLKDSSLDHQAVLHAELMLSLVKVLMLFQHVPTDIIHHQEPVPLAQPEPKHVKLLQLEILESLLA